MCGSRFGHYVEGCPEKVSVEKEVAGDKGGDGGWKVVQKPRRVRKGKEREGMVVDGGRNMAPAGAHSQGSRYNVLNVDGEVTIDNLEAIINGKQKENFSYVKTRDHMGKSKNIAKKGKHNSSNDNHMAPKISASSGSAKAQVAVQEKAKKDKFETTRRNLTWPLSF